MNKILLTTIFIISAKTFAADPLFQGVMAKGIGCPAGKASIVMAPDNNSFTILFDQFTAGLPKTSTLNDNKEAVSIGALPAAFANSPMVELKMCTISFTLNLPGRTRNHEMEVSYDYRGHLYLDQNLGAFFKSLMFQVALNPHGTGPSTHVHSPVENNIYSAPTSNIDQDLTISNKRRVRFTSTPRVKAVNGQQVYINQLFMGFKNVTGVHALNPRLNSNLTGQITIDSSDMTGKMTVRLVSSN
ncbi:MAG: DUF4360 domain-containing protein [Bacteriovoracaceae bacterium]